MGSEQALDIALLGEFADQCTSIADLSFSVPLSDTVDFRVDSPVEPCLEDAERGWSTDRLIAQSLHAKLTIHHHNVTCWGDEVESMFENSPADIMCVCEHHLLDQSCIALAHRLKKSGWTCLSHPAVPSEAARARLLDLGSAMRRCVADTPRGQRQRAKRARLSSVSDIQKIALSGPRSLHPLASAEPSSKRRSHPTGEDRMTSAGVLIAFRNHLCVRPIDIELADRFR